MLRNINFNAYNLMSVSARTTDTEIDIEPNEMLQQIYLIYASQSRNILALLELWPKVVHLLR